MTSFHAEATPGRSPEDLFNDLAKEIDVTPFGFSIDFSGTLAGLIEGISGTLATGQMDITITTEALGVSMQNGQDPALSDDFYWLAHSLLVSGSSIRCAMTPEGVNQGVTLEPRILPRFHQIKVTVSPLPASDDGVVVSGAPAATDLAGIARLFKASAGAIQPVTGSQVLASQPPTTEGSTTIGTSISLSIGANAGMFGDTPTVGIDGSYSVTHSTSVTIPDITVQNLSDGSSAVYLFTAADDSLIGTTTLQPVIQHLFKVPDSGFLRNDRSGDAANAATAPIAVFLIEVEAVVAAVVNFADKFKPQMSVMGLSGTTKRYVAVRVPPMPADSSGLRP